MCCLPICLPALCPSCPSSLCLTWSLPSWSQRCLQVLLPYPFLSHAPEMLYTWVVLGDSLLLRLSPLFYPLCSPSVLWVTQEMLPSPALICRAPRMVGAVQVFVALDGWGGLPALTRRQMLASTDLSAQLAIAQFIHGFISF